MKRYVGSFGGIPVSDESTKDQLLDVIEYLSPKEDEYHKQLKRLVDTAFRLESAPIIQARHYSRFSWIYWPVCGFCFGMWLMGVIVSFIL